MLRQLIRFTAWSLDRRHHMEVTHLVAMCNYRANRFACDAADRAMQTCGGVGYSRHMPFEHIYRHHRRYRITEGSEEIQMRKVGQQLFGFGRGPSGPIMTITTIADVIRTHGADRPDAPALEMEGRSVSFGELDRRSSQVAQAMRAEPA